MNNNKFTEVPHHAGDPQLKAHTLAVERSDAVILIGGKEGTYAAGLSALLRRKMIITIPAFGGSAKDLCEIAEIEHMVIDDLRNLNIPDLGCSNENLFDSMTKINQKWIKDLTNSIKKAFDSYPKLLLVHGRGDNGIGLKYKIENEQDIKGIAEPLIMELSGKGALAVPEVFESYASRVSAIIVIVTADDVGGFARREYIDSDNKNYENKKQYEAQMPATELRLEPRARENVWVEVGWFWGRLGRRRIILWLKDKVPLPSDLSGAAWTKGDLDTAWPEIKQFIKNLRLGGETILPAGLLS